MPLILKGQAFNPTQPETKKEEKVAPVMEQPKPDVNENENRSKEFQKLFGPGGHQKKSGFMDDMFSSE